MDFSARHLAFVYVFFPLQSSDYVLTDKAIRAAQGQSTMMNTAQELLPALFIDFDAIDAGAKTPAVTTRGSATTAVMTRMEKRDGAAEREEMVRILSSQPTEGKTDNKAVSSTVMNALYRKSGLGMLSGMLAAYNC